MNKEVMDALFKLFMKFFGAKVLKLTTDNLEKLLLDKEWVATHEAFLLKIKKGANTYEERKKLAAELTTYLNS